MSFLFPGFLWGALAVAIPIALHLLRRARARRMAFSDVRLLRQVTPRQARQRRLRELLLLALRMAAVVLLALAFARPFVDAAGLFGRPVTVVALDTSYSMGSPDRFAAAQAVARDVIAASPSGAPVGVVAFDDRTRVVSDLSVDRAAAHRAVDGVIPGVRATSYGQAIAAAVDLIGSHHGEIVVVTDLQRNGWAGEAEVTVPSGVDVRVEDVGGVDENLGVTGLDATSTGIVATVTNAGSRPRETLLRVLVDQSVIHSQAAVVAPGSSEVRVDMDLPPKGVLMVVVADPVGLPADDRRYRLLGREAAIPVVVLADRLSSDPLYVERALAVGETARVVGGSPIDARDLSDTHLREVAVMVMLGPALDRTNRQRVQTFVRRGGGLLVAGGPGFEPDVLVDLLAVDGWSAAPVDDVSERRWAITDGRHPIFRPFGTDVAALGNVRFRRTMTLAPSRGRVVAAFSDGSPALVDYQVGEGRVIVFASDLGNAWNDLPRRPGFVPFLHEAVRYLGGARRPGAHLPVADAPPGVAPEPGVHTVPGTARRVVLNVDPRESDLTRVSPDEFSRRIEESDRPDAGRVDAAAGTGQRQELWWYSIVAMIGVLIAEAWLGRTMA